jgi:hypothetical protein
MTKTQPIELVSTRFPARIADLEFTIDVPPDFVRPELPQEEPDFDNTTVSFPLAMVVSPVALVLVAVAARPVYETGSVLQWMRYLAGHFGMTLRNVRTDTVAGGQRAIFADGDQEQDGTPLRFTLVAFEDGGRFITAHAMCPAVMWPSFGEALERAVRSIVLARPMGQTRDVDTTTAIGWRKEDAATPEQMEAFRQELAAKRAEALMIAERSLAEDDYDAAERAIQQADASIYGAVEIARMYERRLKALVASGELGRDKDRVETIFRRAKAWWWGACPEPHTEDEAERAAEGRVADLARLVSILGYTPAE